MDMEREAAAFREKAASLEQEMGKVIVGYRETIEQLLVCLLTRGHALLEGVPGIGKTLFVRTLADVLSLEFKRIQFTPDLMPADITGTHILEESPGGRDFRFREGPIFGNVILADEINRATPKTQSALLEAMSEDSVTVAGERRPLPDPFLVFATQNPIDMEGTYPLPEAQLDRFTFKLLIPAPEAAQLKEILIRTTGSSSEKPKAVLDSDDVRRFRELVRQVHVPDPVIDYVVRILTATHSESSEAARFLRFGASPRGGQALILGGKVRALLDGRLHVSFADVRSALYPSLRHRVLLNFEAEADGMTAERVLESLLESVPETSERVQGFVKTIQDREES